jgi:hypothetical protein
MYPGRPESRAWVCRRRTGACQWPACGDQTRERQDEGDEGEQNGCHASERPHLEVGTLVDQRPFLWHRAAGPHTPVVEHPYGSPPA